MKCKTQLMTWRNVTALLFLLAAQAFGASLDREQIKRVIDAHRDEARACFERALVDQPTLGGKVTVRFVIDPDGRVKAATVAQSTARSAALERCLVERVRGWEFPPHAGDDLVITYPWSFETPAPASAPAVVRDAIPAARYGWWAVHGTLRGVPGCERGCDRTAERDALCVAFGRALVDLEDGKPLDVALAPLQHEVRAVCCDDVFGAILSLEKARPKDRATIWAELPGAPRCPAVERFWPALERRVR